VKQILYQSYPLISPAIAQIKDIHARMTEENKNMNTIGYFGLICASDFGVVCASDFGPNCAII
jgi:hypothetical protein